MRGYIASGVFGIIVLGVISSNHGESKLANRRDYFALLAPLKDRDLSIAASGVDCELAVHAFWCKHLRSIDGADRDQLMRQCAELSGYLKGRLRVDSPEWWEHLLKNGQLAHTSPSHLRKLHPVVNSESVKSVLTVYHGTHASIDEAGSVRVLTEGGGLSIPKVVSDIVKRDNMRNLTAACHDDSMYCVYWPNSFVASTLICKLNTKTGRVTWLKELPDTHFAQVSFGYNVRDIRFDGDGNPCVFGATISAAMIVVLNEENGETITSFNSLDIPGSGRVARPNEANSTAR